MKIVWHKHNVIIFFSVGSGHHMRFPMNTFQGKEASREKQFLLNVITRLTLDFFQIVISLLVYVATFSEQLYFCRNYFFALLQSNYFHTKSAFSEKLFLCYFSYFFDLFLYFFWVVSFFRTVTSSRESFFSEQLLFQSKSSTKQLLLDNR